MWSWFRSWGLCAQQPKDTPPAPPAASASATEHGQSNAPAQEVQDSACKTVAKARVAGAQLDSCTPAAADQKTHSAQDELTPPEQIAPASTTSAGRYIVSASGLPVGIANTVSKYRENQPVVPHLTPFEQRVAAKLTEEQRIAAAAAAATAGPTATAAGAGCDSSSDTSSQGNVAQELFAETAAAAAAAGTSRA